MKVTARIDLKSERPISPFIYGVAHDRSNAVAMGASIIRYGGNPATTVNWKHGFWSSGGDWFFVNNGEDTPPEKGLNNFLDDKKVGIESYITIPIMGRVAKDGKSFAFDINKYPDQTYWVGKFRSGDKYENAGNGWQYVRDENGELIVEKDKDGNPKKDGKGNLVYKCRELQADPDDTSVEMSPEEQTEMLSFMINQKGYGTADKGGLKFMCLDNEQMLWHGTHRGMRQKPCSFDELWDRTKTYASLLKKIDPKIKIAGPALFGWTAYFYSGLDMQLVGKGEGTWENPPDFVKHGRVPLARWYMMNLARHERETGVRLVDILDWHFYPQKNFGNDRKGMEDRVQETRVMWDPAFDDRTWMGNEVKPRGVLRIIPMMKEWIAECNPGMQTSIGEYNFGGDGDVSGGVMQAELLGVFAREGLDFGFYWCCPNAKSSHFYAFRMFRNPDGKYTAFGNMYLNSNCSAPYDISVHAARDTKNNKLTFIVINKRCEAPAQLSIDLGVKVPKQDVVFYEYGGTEHLQIKELPARRIQGKQVSLELLPLTVLRFDVQL